MADKQPTYIMVPRKVVRVLVIVAIVLFIGNIASFQYANYVDRKSNHVWCSLVGLFNESYATNPPNTDLGKQIASEMAKLPHRFYC